MKNFFSRTGAWRLITLIAVITWMVLLYGPILKHPDNYLFSGNGDAIKNYFTFAWHVRYDADWLEFGGMNMPYGEHVGYTDGHPLFSLLLGDFSIIQAHPVGFINLCLLLSMVITAWLLFEVMRLLGIRPWIAAMGAVALQWMEPQICRLEGHLALSYGWVVPLTLLLLIRYVQSGKYRWLLALSLSIIAIFFIHAYLGMLAVMLVLSASLFIFRPWKAMKSISTAASGLIPLAAFAAFMKYTDAHAGRAGKGKGFLEYTSSFESVFLPHGEPFKPLLTDLFGEVNQVWEGWAYLGMPVVIICILSAGFWLIRRRIDPGMQPVFRLWLSSAPVLLFSFGWPFALGWEKGLDLFGPVQQFRAPGRFAWAFYFTSGIAAFGMLDYWLNKSRMKWVPIFFTLLSGSILFLEGWTERREIAKRMASVPNYFSADFLPEDMKEITSELVRREGHSAILPLPFFHYGSDIIALHTTAEVQRWAYVIAYHSGIPLVSSSNPRVSLIESRQIMNLIAQPHEMNAMEMAFAKRGIDEVECVQLDPSLSDAERVLWERASSTPTAGVRTLSVNQLLSDQMGYRKALMNLSGSPEWPVFRLDSLFTPPLETNLKPGEEKVLASWSIPDSAVAGWVAHVVLEVDTFTDLVGIGCFVARNDGQENITTRRLVFAHNSPALGARSVTMDIPLPEDEGVKGYDLRMYNNSDSSCSLRIAGWYFSPRYHYLMDFYSPHSVAESDLKHPSLQHAH